MGYRKIGYLKQILYVIKYAIHRRKRRNNNGS